MNYKCVEVAFDKINKDAERGQTVNISIAAFTTSWKRLRLYHHLDTVNLNALYPDTDSVVYKWWLGQPEIPLGNFLGEVTDELVSGGRMRDHIVNSSPVVLKTMGTGPRGERWVEQCTNSPSTYGGVRCSTLQHEMHCPSRGVERPERTANHYGAQVPRLSTGIQPPRYSRPFIRTRHGAWSLTTVWSNIRASTPFPMTMPGFLWKRNKEDCDGWTVHGPVFWGMQLPVRWPTSVVRSKTGTNEFMWCHTYINISFMPI